MQYSHVTHSIQWPIYWNKLDERQYITDEEAQKRFLSGAFYFSVLWNELQEIVAIIDYKGVSVSIQIFEAGRFEGQDKRVPNAWSVYRAEPKNNYQNLIFSQYRYNNRHYNFYDGVAKMRVVSELLGHDKSYEGTYDKDFFKPLSIAFDDYQTLFDNQAEIQKMVADIEFIEKVRRRK